MDYWDDTSPVLSFDEATAVLSMQEAGPVLTADEANVIFPAGDTTSAYRYDQLQGPEHLRILILKPAISPFAPISCSMEAVALSECEDYTALSYSWGMNLDGDNRFVRDVTVDGKYIAVTQNLYEGLDRLRSTSEPRRLWVDAVCINQGDLAERSAQVSRMAEIFAHATEVAVWLGEDTNGGDDLVQSAILSCFGDDEYDHPLGTHSWPVPRSDELLDLCALRKATSTRSLKTVRRLTGDALREDSLLMAEVRTDYDARNLDSVVRALDSLFNRRYFKRRWILQELYHSPPDRTMLYFGSRNISMNKFAGVCGQSIRSPRSLRRFIVGSSRTGTQDWRAVQYGLREVERVLRLAKDKERTTFLEALERSTHLECSDPRDVLYSLSSLDPEFGVVADYKLSTAAVYTSFAQLLVEKGLWRTVLNNLCRRSMSPKGAIEGLPTWVPDFSEGFMRSSDARDSEESDTLDGDAEYDSQATAAKGTVQCSFFAIGTVNFGQPWASHNIEHIFESWRDRLQQALAVSTLPDVIELSGTQSYEAISMGDIVCSNRRVYTTEEAVIVVLSPTDLKAETFKIVQVHRGNELRSFNGQDVSELSHHSALPVESRFQVAIV